MLLRNFLFTSLFMYKNWLETQNEKFKIFSHHLLDLRQSGAQIILGDHLIKIKCFLGFLSVLLSWKQAIQNLGNLEINIIVFWMQPSKANGIYIKQRVHKIKKKKNKTIQISPRGYSVTFCIVLWIMNPSTWIIPQCMQHILYLSFVRVLWTVNNKSEYTYIYIYI